MSHDEKNEAKVGDNVTIVETRPLSARKRFTLQSINSRARVTHVEAEPAKEVVEEKAETKVKPASKKESK
jgi:hypothetical protein